MNADISYLFGLVVGGGVLHGRTLQIILPYKKWGSTEINPSRAGEISQDILARLNPVWQSHYDMSISFSGGLPAASVCNLPLSTDTLMLGCSSLLIRSACISYSLVMSSTS